MPYDYHTTRRPRSRTLLLINLAFQHLLHTRALGLANDDCGSLLVSLQICSSVNTRVQDTIHLLYSVVLSMGLLRMQMLFRAAKGQSHR